MSTEQVDIPPQVLDYIARERTLTLATSSPAGVPRASTFLYVNDGTTLYFWTRPNTITARHVQQNPTVSFTIDEYTEDLSETRGVQGTGEASVVLSGEDIARVADLFGQKFPELSPGNTMSISFFKVVPTEVEYIDNTQMDTTTPSGDFGAEFHRERAYSIFSELPLANLDTVAVTLERKSVAAGEVIVREGQPAERFFIVVSGEAELLRADVVVGSVPAGSVFGEIAIMRDQPRTTTMRAKTDLELLSLDRETFSDLVAQSLGTTPDFVEIIKSRLKGA